MLVIMETETNSVAVLHRSREKIEQDFKEFDKRRSWGRVLQKIHTGSYKGSTSHSRKLENMDRNRYINVSPFDNNRVRLKEGSNDYINASLVKAPDARRQYILTQGPLSSTAGQFWQMVWEQNSAAVMMLNNVIEKHMVKCHQYFPLGVENCGQDSIEFSSEGFSVSYVLERKLPCYTVRQLQLTHLKTNESRDIQHFHYTSWPDFGVPDSPESFLEFLIETRKGNTFSSKFGPPVIHCSAGIGRSGTFCLVDSCLKMAEQCVDTSCLDIIKIVLSMREYRMGLIQTPEQLRFSYLAIIHGLQSLTLCNGGGKETEEKLAPIVEDKSDNESSDDSSESDDDDSDGEVDDNKGDSSKPHATTTEESSVAYGSESSCQDEPADDVSEMDHSVFDRCSAERSRDFFRRKRKSTSDEQELEALICDVRLKRTKSQTDDN